MSWATKLIEILKSGNPVSFRPKGQSMKPRIKSGQLCTCIPVGSDYTPQVGEVVLCKVNGKQYLHIITALKDQQVQISNNHGFVNGWTSRSNIYGLLIKVEE